MNREEAIRLAKVYLEEETRNHPFALDNLRILNSPTEYWACWYFDYRYYYPEKMPEHLQAIIGDAPGFVIAKQEKQIRAISWHELYEMNQVPLHF